MADLVEKVANGLECCLNGPMQCEKCRYRADDGTTVPQCVKTLREDALSLLKAHEPVHVKYLKASYGSWLLPYCGNCGEQIREDWKCCPVCGKEVNWDG